MSMMLTSISMADVMDRDTAVLHIPKMIRQDEYGYRTSVDGKEVSPLTVVPLDKAFPISKMNGPATSSVVLRRFADGYYVCSCPAWKFSSERDKMRKTCQHLKDVLGEDYEAERISLAKEAKSAVWEQTRFRRTTSDGHQARHNHAKSVLDSHYQQRSQSQSEASSSNLGIVPSTSAAPSFSRKDIISEATRNNSSVSKPLSTHANATQGDSDTETEEEDMSPSQPPRRSRPAPPQTSTLAHPVSTASSTRARSVYEDNDDDHYGLDPDDVQISPSKRARRGGKYTRDDDDKVSLLLAKPWLLDADPSKPRSKAMDPTGWWISEKLDGVRAFWDGQRLYSRQKIEWNAPAWWKERLPKDITLDGELWMSRGTFDQTSQICRTTVRLGRLRTFSHFLERNSMERQWLREQVGGRLASQDRLIAERSARSRLRDAAKERGAAEPVGLASPLATPIGWKALKRSVLCSSGPQRLGVRRLQSKSAPSSRFMVASSFLRALFGLTFVGTSSFVPAHRDRPHRLLIKRCPRCGTIVKPRTAANVLAGVGKRKNVERSTDLAHGKDRSFADPLPSEPVLPSGPTLGASTHDPITTFASLRRPHIYSMLDTSRSIRLTHTHVCRRKSKSSVGWNRIKFMIFDSPSMGSRPVEERWEELEKRFGSTDGLDIDALKGPQIKLVTHIKCNGREHLVEAMKSVELKGGEGLMLRRPGSKYEGRRSSTLFKLKSWYDAEAEVVGYVDGTGRHEGRTGALVARMECGTVFRVGTGMSDAQRENPPPIGSIINYRFFELSEDGNPRFPAFRGIARDKSKPKDAVVRPRASRLQAPGE